MENGVTGQQTEYEINEVMDVTGLLCPEPVMMLHNKIRDVEAGAIVEVLATDPSTQRDIPKFCQFLGHELLSFGERESLYFYHIKKSP